MWRRATVLILLLAATQGLGVRSTEPQVKELGREEALAKAEEDAQLAQNTDELAADAANAAKLSLAEAKEESRLAQMKQNQTQALLDRIKGESDQLAEKEVQAQRVAAAEADESMTNLAALQADSKLRNSSMSEALAEQEAQDAEEKEAAANQRLARVEEKMKEKAAADRVRAEDQQETEAARAAVEASRAKQDELVQTSERHEKEREIRLEGERECAVKQDAKLKETRDREMKVESDLKQIDEKQRSVERKAQQADRGVKEAKKAKQALGVFANHTYTAIEKKHQQLVKQMSHVQAETVQAHKVLTARANVLKIQQAATEGVQEENTQVHDQLRQLAQKILTDADQLKQKQAAMDEEQSNINKAEEKLHSDAASENAQKEAEKAAIKSKAHALKLRERTAARAEESAQKEVFKIQHAARTAAEKHHVQAHAFQAAKTLLKDLTAEERTHKPDDSEDTLTQDESDSDDESKEDTSTKTASMQRMNKRVKATTQKKPATARVDPAKEKRLKDATKRAKKLLADLTQEEEERKQHKAQAQHKKSV